MRCSVTLRRDGGDIVAHSAEYPACEGRGASREEALSRLRQSVLFWLETCPCDQTAEPGLVLTIARDETGLGG